jgi:UbiD family decarboxylase
MNQIMFAKYLVVVDDDVDVHNTSEDLFRLRANNSATRNLESVGGENGFALIFVQLCHGWMPFLISRSLAAPPTV